MAAIAQKKAATPRKKAATPRKYKDDPRILLFDLYVRAVGLPPAEPNYEFARETLGRKWAIDRAWIAERIALEVEGAVYVKGGGAHQRAGSRARPGRYLTDMEKYNRLAVWGWLLIRVTYDMIADGRALALLEEAFSYRRGQGDAA